MSLPRLLRPLPRPASLALVGATLAMLAACSDDGASSASPSASPVVGAAGTTTATAGKDGRVVKDGDRVRVHYRGTLDDGSEFDSSAGRQPLAFQVGSGQVIKGFDEAVRGLEVGQSRTVRMEAKDAYGEVRPELIVDVPLAQAPAGIKAGDRVRMGNGQPATVKEVTADSVRIDANHELAGQALTFAVELVAID